MKCPKCHTENPANSIKCKNCGHIFNARKVLGLRFFSQILIIAFFALTVIGVFGPILTNIPGILPGSEARYDAGFLYFFNNMWTEVLAYKGAGILGYGFTFARALIVSISCIVGVVGVLVTLFISIIKMFQAHHKNQYARLSIRKMFLYSFIPALQYLVLVRFNFINSAYYVYWNEFDATHMGWGAILILIGLVAGFIAVVIEEVPQLEKVDNVGLTRYIAFRIVTCLLVVVAFAGTASYLNYSITLSSTTDPELVVYHQNVFDILTRAYASGDLEALQTIIARAVPAIVMGALAIVATFFAIYNTFTKKRLLLWISVDVVIVCSILCGVFSQSLIKEFYNRSSEYICVTTLGSSTTCTIVAGALAIIALGYEFLNERHGGNLFIKKEDNE